MFKILFKEVYFERCIVFDTNLRICLLTIWKPNGRVSKFRNDQEGRSRGAETSLSDCTGEDCRCGEVRLQRELEQGWDVLKSWLCLTENESWQMNMGPSNEQDNYVRWVHGLECDSGWCEQWPTLYTWPIEVNGKNIRWKSITFTWTEATIILSLFCYIASPALTYILGFIDFIPPLS